jgi:hypothetical protein
VTLRAPEFVGGEIDWYSFDLDDPATGLGTPDTPLQAATRTVSATPLRFTGMPADRLWEFEDAAVNLGSPQVEPHDLARLLLVEFAMTYGNDRLVVPLDVPLGSLTTIDWVTYTNTFGERFLVRRPSTLRANDPWRMFTITTPGGVGLDALLVPPAVVSYEEGAALEEVVFLRDENANVVWAVERTVTAPSGDARSRIDEHAVPPPVTPGAVDRAELDYRLQTGVPDNWIPFLPRTAGYRTLELVQGRIPRFEPREGDPPIPPAASSSPRAAGSSTNPRCRSSPERRCRERECGCHACPSSPAGSTVATSAGPPAASMSARERGRADSGSTSPRGGDRAPTTEHSVKAVDSRPSSAPIRGTSRGWSHTVSRWPAWTRWRWSAPGASVPPSPMPA